MGKLNNLEDLFHHQLRDLYSAEKQLIKALPKMKKEADNDSLKKAFEDHLEETKNQKKRLDEIADILDIDLSGDTCEAMKGLIEEAEEFISEDAAPEVRDAGLIADAQRVEHYEISAYGTAVHYAEALNHEEAAEKLQETLDEESSADEKLNDLAVDNVNKQAKNN
ncbi:ferritin-like domain-containing protein [Fodinibius sp.]|uniref:YciE/YciF ferroxidase family protein n=1 Tax=Fodinibius sp. TaxID=1872440 RepID=UPI003565BA58